MILLPQHSSWLTVSA